MLTVFSQELTQQLVNSSNPFPINFNDAWRVAYPDVAIPETTILRVYRHN